jgi:hypothetical protein
MALFESTDSVGVAQGQADIVEPVHQAVFAEGVDLEWVGETAVAGGNALLLRSTTSLYPGKALTSLNR